MKAWTTFVGDPWDSGCLIVFAETRNKAKLLGWQELWQGFCEYIEMGANRVPELDQYYKEGGPVSITDNNELESIGAPHWYTGEIEL